MQKKFPKSGSEVPRTPSPDLERGDNPALPKLPGGKEFDLTKNRHTNLDNIKDHQIKAMTEGQLKQLKQLIEDLGSLQPATVRENFQLLHDYARKCKYETTGQSSSDAVSSTPLYHNYDQAKINRTFALNALDDLIKHFNIQSQPDDKIKQLLNHAQRSIARDEEAKAGEQSNKARKHTINENTDAAKTKKTRTEGGGEKIQPKIIKKDFTPIMRKLREKKSEASKKRQSRQSKRLKKCNRNFRRYYI
jgi:hypothetical protein